MRILHAPLEIAGQVGLSAYGLREIGRDAQAAFPAHAFDYAIAADLPLGGGSRGTAALRRALTFTAVAARYDVFHFHYGRSFLPANLDARLLRRAGRTVVVEFWGSDVRLPSIETERNPYYVNSYAENDRENRARLQRWAEITDGHVLIPDNYFDVFLAPYFTSVEVVRQRVDTQRFTAVFPDPEARTPLVVHAPSQKAFKGTRHVQEAVRRLQARGLRFEYQEVHNLSQREAFGVYARADLIVDQLCAGSHGVFAVEAMSLGKPTLCYILPEVRDTYPADLPLIDANPDTLERVLEEWIQRPEDRYDLGVRSRHYAVREHDCRVVARRLAAAYDRLAAST
jgi:hypothetical protein